MSFSGLGMKIDDHRSHGSDQQCERCGLLYPKDEKQCIHCGNLDDAQLHEFRQKLQNDEESTRSLGGIFFLLSVVVVLILAISFMA